MIAFFLIAMIASVVFIVEMATVIRRIGGGKPVDRNDHVYQRLKHTVGAALGQRRVRDRWWGWFHVIVFYAFIAFLSGSFELLVQCAYPAWRWSRVIGEEAARINTLIQTYFAWLGIVATAVLSVRRIVCRSRVYASGDAHAILFCIGLILVSHIVSVSCSMALGETASSGLPVTRYLSGLWGDEALDVRHVAMGVHILCISFFLVWIPRGKHLHIILAFPSLFWQYRRYEEGGAVLGVEMPDISSYEAQLESAVESGVSESEWPSYGVVHWRDTTRKMRLETLACSQCMRCTLVCPMVAAKMDEVQGPFASVLSLRAMCLSRRSAGNEVLVGKITSHAEVYSCTQCGACDRACALGVEHTSRIVELRRGVMTHESETGALPEACHKVFRNFEKSGNPWGYPRSKRMDWAKEVESDAATDGERIVEDVESTAAANRPEVDVADVRRSLMFAGCLSAYDVSARKTLVAAVGWLKAQGYEVVRLERETCCGEPLRKLGNEPAFAACVASNCEAIARAPHDVILTLCPHCAQTLKHDYAHGGVRFHAMHMLDFLSRLAKADMLSIDANEVKARGGNEAVMHMPCGLSKFVDPQPIVDFLSRLGMSFADSDVRKSHCCGGGGGQFFIREENVVGMMRARELRKFGAKNIVSACPYCIDMLRDCCVKIESEDVKNGDKSACGEGNSLIGVSNVIDIVLGLTSRKTRVVSSAGRRSRA